MSVERMKQTLSLAAFLFSSTWVLVSTITGDILSLSSRIAVTLAGICNLLYIALGEYYEEDNSKHSNNLD